MLSMDTAPPELHPRPSPTGQPSCRLCGARLHRTVIDLGPVPVPLGTSDHSNTLHVRICDTCTLVQISENLPPQTTTAPSARSTVGRTMEKHHAETMRRRLRLDHESLVIEIGSTGGTILNPYKSAGIPVLSIDPLPNTSTSTSGTAFNSGSAMEIAVHQGCADLVIVNNVLPRMPDPFDFLAGLACIVRPNGIIVLQVPYLLSLIQDTRFDAFGPDIYTYLSLRVLEHALRAVGLRVFDAERLADDGGQLRIQACHTLASHQARPGLKLVRLAERFADLERHDFYSGFSRRVTTLQTEIRDFLGTRRAAGRRVSAYGATSQGITLLNTCGITIEEIACIADPDPTLHGRLIPGAAIPIVSPAALVADPPEDLIILPWSNAPEIAQDLAPLRQRGTQFWTLVPRIMRA